MSGSDGDPSSIDVTERPPGRLRRHFAAHRRAWLKAVAGVSVVVLAVIVLAPASRPLDPLKQPALVLMSADGVAIARRGAFKDVPVKVDDLPDHVGQAFVAIEDKRFYSHPGVDARSIARAAMANREAGGVVQGGSTITQQLAKNSYLQSERTFGRKLQEAVIAMWLEIRLSKADILSAYLSSVYFGEGVYGLRAASQYYFAKGPEALTVGEAAILAGLVKAPSKINPVEDPAAAGRRARLVLNAMADQGYISAGEARDAGYVRVHLPQRELPVGTYFADWVTPTARDAAPRDYGEAVIRTTLDARMQRSAERTVSRALAPYPGVQVALVALTPDGAIRAMVGGRSYARSQFNRATQAKRQPGSAFKPFVYLAAIRQGWKPDSLIDDTPLTRGKWRPENYENRYTGRITLRDAFAQSSNVAAVRLIQDVGPRRVVDAARDLGVTSKLRADETLALGTSETTLLELTSAYAALAAGAGPVKAYGVERGTPPEGTAPIGLENRAAMLNLLQAAVAGGTGRQAALTQASWGKTGTTQGNRDAVFVGFVDGLVVGVWVGKDDQTPMRGVTGGGLPAQIWSRFMQELGYQAGGGPRPAMPVSFAGMAPARSLEQPRREQVSAPRREEFGRGKGKGGGKGKR